MVLAGKRPSWAFKGLSPEEKHIYKMMSFHLRMKCPQKRAAAKAWRMKNYRKNLLVFRERSRLSGIKCRRRNGIKPRESGLVGEERYIYVMLCHHLKMKNADYAKKRKAKQKAAGLKWYKENLEYARKLSAAARKRRLEKHPELRKKASFFSQRYYWKNPEPIRAKHRKRRWRIVYGEYAMAAENNHVLKKAIKDLSQPNKPLAQSKEKNGK